VERTRRRLARLGADNGRSVTDARAVAERYFAGWRSRDFENVRNLLADDVTFRGPLGTADGADECIAGLRGMSELFTGIDIHVIAVDGEDVITWYDLRTKDAPPIPTANWMQLSAGTIARIRATFDPRPIISG
jgi:limonene-1,2-epoxide hydrolase